MNSVLRIRFHGWAGSVGRYDFSSMISEPSRWLIRRLIAARRSFCW